MPGIAVFPHPNKDSTPLALRANVKHNHVLHEHVIIVSTTTAQVPHVPPSEAFVYDDLGYTDDGIEHLTIRFGFSDEPDIPRALRDACRAGVLAAQGEGLQPRVVLHLARSDPHHRRTRAWCRWRRSLFVALAHNAADPAARFGLPALRTVTMGSDVEI